MAVEPDDPCLIFPLGAVLCSEPLGCVTWGALLYLSVLICKGRRMKGPNGPNEVVMEVPRGTTTWGGRGFDQVVPARSRCSLHFGSCYAAAASSSSSSSSTESSGLLDVGEVSIYLGYKWFPR